MNVGFFTMPIHPAYQDWRLSLQYAGKVWTDRKLSRQSMIQMAKKVMPRIDASMSDRAKTAE